jgi:site-specific DNA-methyltransferase (cytosine-N4-specific)
MSQEFLNKVVCGDCGQICKGIEDKTFNAVITSPPYADIKGKYKNNFSAPSPDDYADWFLPKVKEFYRVLKDDGSFILNIDDKVEDGFRSIYVYDLVCRITRETGFKLFEHLYWNKGKFLPSKTRFSNKIEYIFWFVKQKDFVFNLDEMRIPYNEKSIKRSEKPIKKRFVRTEENQKDKNYKKWILNPKGASPSTLLNIGSESKRISDNNIAVYPEKLAEYFIKGSTNIGDLIYDPFCGAGTTCVSAKKLCRNYFGTDIFQEYVDFSKERIENANRI